MNSKKVWSDNNQMLGCGAHVRIIATPPGDVRAEVRAERVFELCV